MTLMEALNTNQKIKRMSDGNMIEFLYPDDRSFSKSDITATDWMIEERHVLISKSKFNKAVELASSEYDGLGLFESISKHLGL